MSMPPPGHPMHPEMLGAFGPPVAGYAAGTQNEDAIARHAAAVEAWSALLPMREVDIVDYLTSAEQLAWDDDRATFRGRRVVALSADELLSVLQRVRAPSAMRVATRGGGSAITRRVRGWIVRREMSSSWQRGSGVARPDWQALLASGGLHQAEKSKRGWVVGPRVVKGGLFRAADLEALREWVAAS